MQKRRKQLLVDGKVQGAIIKRVLMYWFACLMFITLPIILTMAVNDPTVYWFHHIPAILIRFWPIYLVMLALLPFVLRDALAFSNRFCGPLNRMLRELNDYNRGGSFKEVNLRNADFWQPMASALNTALQEKKNA